MTSNETKLFNNILEEVGIQYTEQDGLYELNEKDYVQTNGYNLLKSIQRLMSTEIVERKLS